MDPDVTLAILRQTIAEFRRTYDADQGISYRSLDSRAETLIDLGDTLAESADALDQWMSKGGFKPRDWDEQHAS